MRDAPCGYCHLHGAGLRVDHHQIGALAPRDLAAIRQPDDAGRGGGDHSPRLRQITGATIRQREGRLRQCRIVVIRDQSIAQAQLHQILCRDIARLAAAAHHIGRAHQHGFARLPRGLRGGEGGGEFADHRAMRTEPRAGGRTGIVMRSHPHTACAERGGKLRQGGLDIGLLRLRAAHDLHHFRRGQPMLRRPACEFIGRGGGQIDGLGQVVVEHDVIDTMLRDRRPHGVMFRHDMGFEPDLHADIGQQIPARGFERGQ